MADDNGFSLADLTLPADTADLDAPRSQSRAAAHDRAALAVRERAVAFRTRVDGLLAELTHASAQLHLAQRGRLARRRTHAQEPIAAALVELRRAHASAKAEHSALCADLRERRAEIVDDLSWRVFCTRLEHDFEHEAQPVRAAPLDATATHQAELAYHRARAAALADDAPPPRLKVLRAAALRPVRGEAQPLTARGLAGNTVGGPCAERGAAQRLLRDLIASTQHVEPERTPRRRAEPRKAELPLFAPSLALHADVLSWARPGAGSVAADRRLYYAADEVDARGALRQGGALHVFVRGGGFERLARVGELSAVRASGAELRLRVPPAVLGECVAAVADEPGGFAGGEGELQLALRVATVEQLLRAEDAVARVVSAADRIALQRVYPAGSPVRSSGGATSALTLFAPLADSEGGGELLLRPLAPHEVSELIRVYVCRRAADGDVRAYHALPEVEGEARLRCACGSLRPTEASSDGLRVVMQLGTAGGGGGGARAVETAEEVGMVRLLEEGELADEVERRAAVKGGAWPAVDGGGGGVQALEAMCAAAERQLREERELTARLREVASTHGL